MRIGFLFSILLAAAATYFALQNPGYTDLKLGPYLYHWPTAIILLVTFAGGVLVGLLMALPGRIRAGRKARKLQRRLETAPAAGDHAYTSSYSSEPRSPGSNLR